MHQSDNGGGGGEREREERDGREEPPSPLLLLHPLLPPVADEDDPIRDEETQKPIKGDDERATCTARQNNRDGHGVPPHGASQQFDDTA